MMLQTAVMTLIERHQNPFEEGKSEVRIESSLLKDGLKQQFCCGWQSGFCDVFLHDFIPAVCRFEPSAWLPLWWIPDRDFLISGLSWFSAGDNRTRTIPWLMKIDIDLSREILNLSYSMAQTVWQTSIYWSDHSAEKSRFEKNLMLNSSSLSSGSADLSGNTMRENFLMNKAYARLFIRFCREVFIWIYEFFDIFWKLPEKKIWPGLPIFSVSVSRHYRDRWVCSKKKQAESFLNVQTIPSASLRKEHFWKKELNRL